VRDPNYVCMVCIVPKAYRDEDLQSTRDAGLQVGIQDDGAESNQVPRLVDGFVQLDEHRVALVHIDQTGGVIEVQRARTFDRQVVLTRA
jgi:hypothetical protein